MIRVSIVVVRRQRIYELRFYCDIWAPSSSIVFALLWIVRLFLWWSCRFFSSSSQADDANDSVLDANEPIFFHLQFRVSIQCIKRHVSVSSAPMVVHSKLMIGNLSVWV